MEYLNRGTVVVAYMIGAEVAKKYPSAKVGCFDLKKPFKIAIDTWDGLEIIISDTGDYVHSREARFKQLQECSLWLKAEFADKPAKKEVSFDSDGNIAE